MPIARLTAALFRETNPAPLKYALSLLGLMSSEVRLPLVVPDTCIRADIASVVAQICDDYGYDMIGGIVEAAPRSRRAATS